jgi:hypothetical protein
MSKLATTVLSAVLSIALVNGVGAVDKAKAASGKAEFRNS